MRMNNYLFILRTCAGLSRVIDLRVQLWGTTLGTRFAEEEFDAGCRGSAESCGIANPAGDRFQKLIERFHWAALQAGFGGDAGGDLMGRAVAHDGIEIRPAL